MARRLKRRTFLKAATGGVLTLGSRSILGANDRVRLGVIGVGEWGQQLIRQALWNDNVEVVAVADVYDARHHQAQRLVPGVTAYFDYRSILDRQDVDAVMIATPLHLHASQFLNALSAGKDVYCEKTMAYSIEEAKRCRDAAEMSDRVVSIGLQHQSSGWLSDIQQFIARGMLGKVTAVQAWKSRKITWLRPVPPDVQPEHVRWEAFLGPAPVRPFDPSRFINWKLYWDYAGGIVTELMVHQVAFILRALNLPIPETVYASGGIYVWRDGREVPDTVSAIMDFPAQGVTVSWTGTLANPFHGIGERYLGTDGTIERLLGATNPMTGKGEDSLWYYPNRSDGLKQPGTTPDVNHVRNFIECVRSRRTPNAPVEIGYRSAVTVHMVNLSYRLGRRVHWDPLREEAIVSEG